MSVFGSIESVNLKGRKFVVPADAEAQRKTGGWENEVESNGDGSVRIIKTRVPFSLDGLSISIQDEQDDMDYLQDLADLKGLFTFSITYVSGLTLQGRCAITGELALSSMNGTTPISLKGPGRITAQ